MDTEAALVARSRDGNVEAFARLIELHQPVALRVAYAIAGPDAEDAVQDAFVKAFTRLPQFDGDQRFGPWLLAIVANESRNRRRSSGRRHAVELRLATRPGGSLAGTPSADPAQAVVHADDADRLLHAVARLSPRHREVVALRFFADLSETETADALGCAVGTVKSRLSRALVRLRSALSEEAVR